MCQATELFATTQFLCVLYKPSKTDPLREGHFYSSVCDLLSVIKQLETFSKIRQWELSLILSDICDFQPY
jgi:hypothetical protein